MAATASILAPRTNDTVSASNVVITTSYEDFSGQTLTGTIAGMSDTAVTPTGTDVHVGSSITGVTTGSQDVKVLIDNAVENTQTGVIVSSDQLPVPIEEPLEPATFKEAKKKFQVQGKKVPDGSAAAYVVCQAIEINTATHASNVVAAGAGNVEEDKKWKVTLEFDINDAAGIQYVVSASAFDKNQNFLGKQTVFAKKKK